jgi:hypothetical protein
MAHPIVRGGLGCVGLVLFAAAALSAQWAFDAFIDAPWAHSIGGRPTLTGQWTGALDAAGAPDGAVWLEIIRGSGAKRRGVAQVYDDRPLNGQPTLRGSAVWCRKDGTVTQYKLSGFATHGGDPTITFTTTAAPTRTGKELNESRGHWTGTALTLAASQRLFTVASGRSTTIQPLSGDSVRMTLHPASAGTSNSACGPSSNGGSK